MNYPIRMISRIPPTVPVSRTTFRGVGTGLYSRFVDGSLGRDELLRLGFRILVGSEKKGQFTQ